MQVYTVGVAGLAVNQLLHGSGGSTPSTCTNLDERDRRLKPAVRIGKVNGMSCNVA